TLSFAISHRTFPITQGPVSSIIRGRPTGPGGRSFPSPCPRRSLRDRTARCPCLSRGSAAPRALPFPAVAGLGVLSTVSTLSTRFRRIRGSNRGVHEEGGRRLPTSGAAFACGTQPPVPDEQVEHGVKLFHSLEAPAVALVDFPP